MKNIQDYRNYTQNENLGVESLRLLNLVEGKYGFKVTVTAGDKFNGSLNLPNEKGSMYTVRINKIYTVEDFKESLLDEGIDEELISKLDLSLPSDKQEVELDEWTKEVYDAYFKDIGKEQGISFSNDEIEYRVCFSNVSEVKKPEFFKEACLLYAKKELHIMLSTVLENRIDNFLDMNEILGSKEAFRLLGGYLKLQNIEIKSNRHIQWIPEVAYRIYKNCKAIDICLDDDKTKSMLKDFIAEKYN